MYLVITPAEGHVTGRIEGNNIRYFKFGDSGEDVRPAYQYHNPSFLFYAVKNGTTESEGLGRILTKDLVKLEVENSVEITLMLNR